MEAETEEKDRYRHGRLSRRDRLETVTRARAAGIKEIRGSLSAVGIRAGVSQAGRGSKLSRGWAA